MNQAIMEIYEGLKEVVEAVNVPAVIAQEVAEAYQNVLDNDFLSKSATPSANSVVGTGVVQSDCAVTSRTSEEVKACGKEWMELLTQESKSAIH